MHHLERREDHLALLSRPTGQGIACLWRLQISIGWEKEQVADARKRKSSAAEADLLVIACSDLSSASKRKAIECVDFEEMASGDGV